MTGILKLLWVIFWAALATLVFFVPMTLAALFSRTGNLAFTISRGWAYIMARAMGLRLSIRGREKIAKGQTYVIISNHQSHTDILALVLKLGIQFRWIIKRELLRIPLFGWALYSARNVFIDRSDREKAVQTIHEGLDRLPPGVSVLFFAEGTRSADGAIGPFKKGGFVMAVEKGIPLLPVTINGSRRVLPKGSVAFRPGPIEVVVGEPVDTAKYGHETLESLMALTRDIVKANHNPGFP